MHAFPTRRVRQNIGIILFCKRHVQNTPNMATTKGQEGQKIQQYAMSRYMQFLTKYQKHLEKQFPSMYHMYRIFMAGIKDFYRDVKLYFKVVTKLNMSEEGFHDLTYRELHIYHQMPKDMIRVAPVLFLSALPFTNYIILPLLYAFPRHLLCSHFWTLQQRVEFATQRQRERLYNYRPVFRCLQEQLTSVRGGPLHATWRGVLWHLGSGTHPTTDDVLICKQLFQGEPYSLLHLYTNHVKGLLRVHSMHTGWRRRTRLAEQASILHELDNAIIRGGGIRALSHDDLRWACFMRGLSPGNVRLEDLEGWLAQWLSISREVDESCWSLLLHCPILLAYNHPSNWILIH